MRKSKSTLRYTIALATSVAAVSFFVGPAAADDKQPLNSQLQGTYPFNETLIFGVAPVTDGSSNCSQSLPPGAIQQQLTLTNHGMWTFDGAGHLTISDDGILTTLPGTNQFTDVSASHADCAGTYQLMSDGSVDMHYNCSVAGGLVQFADIHTVDQITQANILVASPNTPDGKLVVGPQYLVINGSRKLIACIITAENTTIGRLKGAHFIWPSN